MRTLDRGEKTEIFLERREKQYDIWVGEATGLK